MKKNYLKNRIKSFIPAFQGLKTVFNDQANFRIHIFVAPAVIGLSLVLKISKAEFLLMILLISFVLTAELFNSALEYLSDFVSPEKQALIKKSKDAAAAAVLISASCAVTIGCFIFLPRLWEFF